MLFLCEPNVVLAILFLLSNNVCGRCKWLSAIIVQLNCSFCCKISSSVLVCICICCCARRNPRKATSVVCCYKVDIVVNAVIRMLWLLLFTSRSTGGGRLILMMSMLRACVSFTMASKRDSWC